MAAPQSSLTIGTEIMHQTRQSTHAVVFMAALMVMAVASARAGEGQNGSPENERELIAVLRSDAPAADKALACKHLAIHGSSAAVPELARLYR